MVYNHNAKNVLMFTDCLDNYTSIIILDKDWVVKRCSVLVISQWLTIINELFITVPCTLKLTDTSDGINKAGKPIE